MYNSTHGQQANISQLIIFVQRYRILRYSAFLASHQIYGRVFYISALSQFPEQTFPLNLGLNSLTSLLGMYFLRIRLELSLFVVQSFAGKSQSFYFLGEILFGVGTLQTRMFRGY